MEETQKCLAIITAIKSFEQNLVSKMSCSFNISVDELIKSTILIELADVPLSFVTLFDGKFLNFFNRINYNQIVRKRKLNQTS